VYQIMQLIQWTSLDIVSHMGYNVV